MSEWLKRDPDNGLLIGPDDCHYANEHRAAHYGLLRLCGCGSPVEAFNLCRDILSCFDRRKEEEGFINAEETMTKIIKERPEETAHVLAHLFANLDLIEHGSSVSWSWLTKDGERIVDLGPMTEEIMDDQEVSK